MPPQGGSPLPSQRFPLNASSEPLNRLPARAYRPAMPAHFQILPANPRLQRTPWASPLSCEMFGGMKGK